MLRLTAPDPRLIMTREDAIAALSRIVASAGLDPGQVLAPLLSGPPSIVAPEVAREALGRFSSLATAAQHAAPPRRYERGARGSWRSLVAEVLVSAGRPLSAGEIAAGVAARRGVETGTQRDYRFIERCTGVVLSRHRGLILEEGYRLVQQGDGRGSRYRVEALEASNLAA